MLPIFAFLLIGSAYGATLNIITPKGAPVPAVLIPRADNITEERTTLSPVGLSVVPLIEVTTQATTEHVETTIAPATTKTHQIATVTPRPKNNGNRKTHQAARVAPHRAATPTEPPQHHFNTVNATRLPIPAHGKKNAGRLTRIEKTSVEKTVVIGEGIGSEDVETPSRSRREEATTAVVQVIQVSTTETPVVNVTIPVVVVNATVVPVEVVSVTVGSGEVVKKELNRPARQLVGGVGGVPVGGVGAGMGPVGGMGGLGGGIGGIGGGMGTGLGGGGAVVEDTVTQEEIVTP